MKTAGEKEKSTTKLIFFVWNKISCFIFVSLLTNTRLQKLDNSRKTTKYVLDNFLWQILWIYLRDT